MSTTPPLSPSDDAGRSESDLPAAMAGELARSTRDVVDHVSLKQALIDVARITADYIEGADGVGTTLNLGGRMVMTASDKPWVIDIDAVQYGLGQGPCVSAVATGITACTNDLGRDRRWPEFSAATTSLEVGSVLSLPLLGPHETIGCLNVYSRRRDAFEPRAIDAGNRFAPHVAVAVRSAQLRAVTWTLANQLDLTVSQLEQMALTMGAQAERRRRDDGKRPGSNG